jgi:uncharacterized protein
MIQHIIYLHGLASSPSSNKATIFRAPFNERGINYVVPDLNVPDFEHLTLTAMLAKVAETMNALPPASDEKADVALIGSSMGGLTALHFADRYRGKEADRVAKLVLMAPALDFMSNRRRSLGAEGLAAWQKSGTLPVFHYAYGGERNLHYGLVEDVQQYDSDAVNLDLPILIFHGTHDESVDYTGSVRFAAAHPHVMLRLLDSDHQLLDQTDTIWDEMVTFLALRIL